MLTKANENDNIQQDKSTEEKPSNMNSQKEMDEYDIHLHMELENFRKSPQKLSKNSFKYSDNAEKQISNENHINTFFEKEDFNIEKNSNYMKDSCSKSLKSSNTYNISNNFGYNNYSELSKSVAKNTLLNENQNPKIIIDNVYIPTNIGNNKFNDLSDSENSLNNKDDNANKIIESNVIDFNKENNFFATSVNGNPNINNVKNIFNNESQDKNTTFNNYDNNFQNFNQNYNSDLGNNNNSQDINAITVLNNYLPKKNSNPNKNLYTDYEKEMADDNERYMFSNNIEYSNYNVNTNFDQENLENHNNKILNTEQIINQSDKPNANKSIKNNLISNFKDINSLDEDVSSNYNHNHYTNLDNLNDKKIDNLNEITTSNFSNIPYCNINNLNNFHNKPNLTIDYNEQSLKGGTIKSNKNLFPEYKATEYDSILNNDHHKTYQRNSKIPGLNLYKLNNNQFNPEYKINHDLNLNLNSNLNDNLDEKSKQGPISLKTMSTVQMYSFSSKKKAAYEKSNSNSFAPNNIKTLSDQTLCNSDLHATKYNNRSNHANLNENFNNENESNNYKLTDEGKAVYLFSDEKNGFKKNLEDSSAQFNYNKNDETNKTINRHNFSIEKNEINGEDQISLSENFRNLNKDTYSLGNLDGKLSSENQDNNEEANTERNDQQVDKEDEINYITKDKIFRNKKKNNYKQNENPNNILITKPINFVNIQESNKNIKRILRNQNQNENNFYLKNSAIDPKSNQNHKIYIPENDNDFNPYFPNTVLDSNKSYNNNKLKSKEEEHLNEYNPLENSRNDIKLKALQKKIEEKIRKEYESKIQLKEHELSEKTKTDFEAAMKKLKIELEKNLEEEKAKLENDVKEKWDNKYDSLIIECRAKLRSEKEKKLAENMYQKLKPVVEKEIYNKEFCKVEGKIRNEIEDKIKNQIENKKKEEIEKVKKKFELFTKNKMEEIESNIRSKCKEELESEMKKEIERKEKEIKINYSKKFEGFKSRLEHQLIEEFELKKKQLMKEIGVMKAKIYSQRCLENLKIQKLNNIRDILQKTEMNTLLKAEKVEKILSNQSKEKKHLHKKSASSAFSINKNIGENNKNNRSLNSSVNSSLNNKTRNGHLNSFSPNYKKNLTSFTNSNLKIKENIQTKNPKNIINKTNSANNFMTSKKKDLILNIDDNSENNFMISYNINMNSPTSANLENNFSSYIKQEESFISNPNSKDEIQYNQQMNAVNLIELNKRLKISTRNNYNTKKRQKSIFIKESSPTENIPKDSKTLSENLQELIDNNSKLHSPLRISEHPSFRVLNERYLNKLGLNSNDNNNNFSPINFLKINSPEKKKNFNLNGKSNDFNNNNNNSDIISGLNSFNKYSNENYKEFSNQESINNLISPKNTFHNNLNSRILSPNKTQGFMQPNNSNRSNIQTSKVSTRKYDCISLTSEKNFPLSLNHFGKFLVKYIEKEENFKVLYEKEIKFLKEKIKKIFHNNDNSDHCLLEYILELWDKLEVSYSIRYKILMGFCKV